MNLKEYKAQKAVGTLPNYRKIAFETKNSAVLAQIVEDTSKVEVRAAVASNPKVTVKILTRILIDIETPDFIIDMCIWNPKITKSMLELWKDKKHLRNRNSFLSKLHGLQAAEGLNKAKRVKTQNVHDLGKPIPHINYPNTMNPNVTWTTGTNDIDKAPHIYAYTDKNMNDKNMNDKNMNDKNMNDKNMNDKNIPSTFTNNMLLEKPKTA